LSEVVALSVHKVDQIISQENCTKGRGTRALVKVAPSAHAAGRNATSHGVPRTDCRRGRDINLVMDEKTQLRTRRTYAPGASSGQEEKNGDRCFSASTLETNFSWGRKESLPSVTEGKGLENTHRGVYGRGWLQKKSRSVKCRVRMLKKILKQGLVGGLTVR